MTIDEYCGITLLFPNKTTVKIEGDLEVVQQIVNRLDGLKVDYHDKKTNELV